MSLAFLRPVEHFGRRFDRAMTLFEFSALREPEATQFPQIGAWLRAKGVEFNEVPTPQMLWRGRMWPDLFIANQLDAVPDGWCGDLGIGLFGSPAADAYAHPRNKFRSAFYDDQSLEDISEANHGEQFHDTFIEPMCRKITGRSAAEISAKYHRALWLCLYWPQTLRTRTSIPTPFYYPTKGYAGAVKEALE